MAMTCQVCDMSKRDQYVAVYAECCSDMIAYSRCLESMVQVAKKVHEHTTIQATNPNGSPAAKAEIKAEYETIKAANAKNKAENAAAKAEDKVKPVHHQPVRHPVYRHYG